MSFIPQAKCVEYSKRYLTTNSHRLCETINNSTILTWRNTTNLQLSYNLINL